MEDHIQVQFFCKDYLEHSEKENMVFRAVKQMILGNEKR